jgi:AcrR family transcriptional regulator/DNA-binding MarR family transcriptional regulator
MAGRVRMRRPGVPGPRGGGVYVPELQRGRLLDAAFAVVAERGYRRMTVRQVAGRAGVSNKTFYDLFEDHEACFLAAFDQAVEELATVVVPVWEGEREWAARIRAGLETLLGVLDREPPLCRLVFVEALGGGTRVLQRRAEILEVLGGAINQGRTRIGAGRELPPLTAEGLVGAAFSVIHAQLLQTHSASLTDLLNPLMAMIVLPYRGHAAAARELQHPASQPAPDIRATDKSRVSGPVGRISGSRAIFKPTLRTQLVLAAVAEHPGASNRELSDHAQIVDQGQISKLLARLEGHGLLTNTGGETQGNPNAWQLTAHGEATLQASNAKENRATTSTASHISTRTGEAR